MRSDRIVIGRDYRLRYARPGHYRVRALGWRVSHGLDGKTSSLLRVEWREEDTGHDYPGIEREFIRPAEILGPWSDAQAVEKAKRAERQGSVIVSLRDALASSKVEATVLPKRGSVDLITIEVSADNGETLARVLPARVMPWEGGDDAA